MQATSVLRRGGGGGGAGDAPVVLEVLRQRPVTGLDRRAQIVQLRFDLQNKRGKPVRKSEMVYVELTR